MPGQYHAFATESGSWSLGGQFPPGAGTAMGVVEKAAEGMGCDVDAGTVRLWQDVIVGGAVPDGNVAVDCYRSVGCG